MNPLFSGSYLHQSLLNSAGDIGKTNLRHRIKEEYQHCRQQSGIGISLWLHIILVAKWQFLVKEGATDSLHVISTSYRKQLPCWPKRPGNQLYSRWVYLTLYRVTVSRIDDMKIFLWVKYLPPKFLRQCMDASRHPNRHTDFIFMVSCIPRACRVQFCKDRKRVYDSGNNGRELQTTSRPLERPNKKYTEKMDLVKVVHYDNVTTITYCYHNSNVSYMKTSKQKKHTCGNRIQLQMSTEVYLQPRNGLLTNLYKIDLSSFFRIIPLPSTSKFWKALAISDQDCSAFTHR